MSRTLPAAKKRIESLDVMRGLTVAFMILVNNSGSSYAQLHHSEWNGLTLCDMVFPFFIFIMGVSTYLSLSKKDFRADKSLLGPIFRRTALIILICWAIAYLGWALKGDFLPFSHLRLTGVLVRIALCYMLLSLISLSVRPKHFPYIIALILILYGVLLHFGNGYSNDAGNIISRVDTFLLGKEHLYSKKPIDPEGLLGTLPALAQAMLGFLCASILKSDRSLSSKLKTMLLVGASLLAAGYLLSLLQPLNKRIWSPSFTLVTSGYAYMVLAVLCYIIDYKNINKWTAFFKAFGLNALAVYVFSEVLSLVLSRSGLSNLCHEGLRSLIGNIAFADLLYALIFVLVCYLFALPLFKKKIIIKL